MNCAFNTPIPSPSAMNSALNTLVLNLFVQGLQLCWLSWEDWRKLASSSLLINSSMNCVWNLIFISSHPLRDELCLEISLTNICLRGCQLCSLSASQLQKPFIVALWLKRCTQFSSFPLWMEHRPSNIGLESFHSAAGGCLGCLEVHCTAYCAVII